MVRWFTTALGPGSPLGAHQRSLVASWRQATVNYFANDADTGDRGLAERRVEVERFAHLMLSARDGQPVTNELVDDIAARTSGALS